MNRTPTNQRPPTSRFLLAACARCGGDGFLDATDEEYRCLQCSRLIQTAETPALPGSLEQFLESALASRDRAALPRVA